MKKIKMALIGHGSSPDRLALILRQNAQHDLIKMKSEYVTKDKLAKEKIDVALLVCSARNVAPCCQLVKVLKNSLSAHRIIVISEIKDPDLMYAVLKNGISKFVVGRLDDIALGSTLIKEINKCMSTALTQRILAIGAHPDDVEIGCGGTIKKHVDRGDEVLILTLTKGAQGGDKEKRTRESQHAALSLNAQLKMYDLVDTKLSTGGDTIISIEETIKAFDPSIIYTHSLNDTHQDHRATHYATLVAARKIEKIYAYLAPSGTIDFHPRYFEHIEDYIDDKMKAINCFTSQTVASNRPYLKKSIIQSTAQYWGRFSNYGYVEPYEVIRA